MATPDSTIPERCCSKCKQEFPLTAEYFEPEKTCKSGFRGVCRLCRRDQKDAASLKYRALNRDKIRERGRQRYRENSEKEREKRKQYYWTHRDSELSKNSDYHKANWTAILARKRRYRRANADHFNALRRIWWANNPLKVKGFNRKSAAIRRARVANAEGSFTQAELRALFGQQRGLCWWCGVKLEQGFHADHRVPLAKGGTNSINNIVLACPKCNLSKGAKLPHEWNGRLL